MQALGQSWQMPAPPPMPVRLQDVAYEEETMSIFTPQAAVNVLVTEANRLKGKPVTEKDAEDAYVKRQSIRFIPQPAKKGPDGVTPICTSGAILTNDVLVCYWAQEPDDKGGMKDVLNFYLLWSDGKGLDRGWTMPGMRDRAYESENPTISAQDANAYLVCKECGVTRGDIYFQTQIAAFDDRFRDDRFIPFSLIGLVVLNRTPPIIPGKAIGLPLDKLKQLVNCQIQVNHMINDPERAFMARSHDSLLRRVFRTAKFYHTMDKIRIAQGQYRELLRANPRAERPPLPVVEPNQECQICMNLMAGAHVICDEGHSICKLCLPEIQKAGKCHVCHERPLLARPIKNRQLDDLIQSLHPDEYRARFQEMNNGEVPKSWEDYEVFKGNLITYKS